MQLIYLYVEKYKNIKDQGFNFSSRFTCSFDKDNKQLAITEREDYIKDFFGKNIEVTAIVGENGAGKSSIIEFLACSLVGIYSEEIGKYIIVYSDGDECYIKSSGFNYKELNKNIPTVELISIRNYWVNLILPDWGKYNERLNRELKAMYVMQGGLNRNGYGFIDKLVSLNETYRELISNVLNEKFLFDSFDLKVALKDKSYINHVAYSESKLKDKFKELLKDLDKLFYLENKDFFNLDKKINPSSILEYNALMFLLHFALDNEDDLSSECKCFLSDLKYHIQKPKDIFSQLNKFIGLLRSTIITDEPYKQSIYQNFKEQVDAINYLKNKKLVYDKEIDCLIHKTDLSNNRQIDNIIGKTAALSLFEAESNYCSLLIEYDFSNCVTGTSYQALSSGEKKIFQICIELVYQTIFSRGNKKSLILFSDELEQDLHPEWQRELFLIIVNILNKLLVKLNSNLHLHFITTTHSPFILSDIPNQNILFLKKGAQVEAFKKRNTFGANIHTLLSDGFFMEGGLMGEFAKNKINDLYESLTNKKSKKYTKIDSQNIINLIGEPVLQKELQFLHDKKFEIDDIEKEIREHEEAIKKLKQRKKYD